MSKKANAPAIRPQVRVHFEQINFKIDTETLEKLRAYSQFIDSEQGYVIREALTFLFASDHSFQEYLQASVKIGMERTHTSARDTAGEGSRSGVAATLPEVKGEKP